MKQCADELAIASTINRWIRLKKRPTRIYTRAEIEMFALNSQRLKVEAYKQARRALEKPFSV